MVLDWFLCPLRHVLLAQYDAHRLLVLSYFASRTLRRADDFSSTSFAPFANALCSRVCVAHSYFYTYFPRPGFANVLHNIYHRQSDSGTILLSKVFYVCKANSTLLRFFFLNNC